MDAQYDCLRLSQRLASDGAGVFERYRVSLLRHDAAGLYEAIAQPQVIEFRSAPQQQILHETAMSGEQHGRGGRAFEQIIYRGDAAVGIDGGSVEAQQIGSELAVDWKTGSGDGAGAQRIAVGALVRADEAGGIALELFHHSEQVMRDGGRLRPLGVSVDGEDGFAMTSRESSAASGADRAWRRKDRGCTRAAACGTSSYRYRCGCVRCAGGRRYRRRTRRLSDALHGRKGLRKRRRKA